MKIKLLRSTRQLASTLLTVLIICTLLSLSVAGYLTLVEQQHQLSFRSQSWNTAIAIVEAGIEDGLEQLNSNSTNLLSNGWSSGGNSTFVRSQTLADGNSYSVTINFLYPNTPTITAQATVVLPTIAQNSLPFLFAAGGQTVTGSASVTRAVAVTCGKNSLFTAAMVAKKKIDLNGNNVSTDSFDSSDPAKSSNGKYDASLYSGDMGDIATDGGIESTVSVGNANVYGKVHTGPNCPVNLLPNGAVGTHAWQALNHTGFEDGYVLQDANFTFPDTSLPSTVGLFQPDAGTNIVNLVYTNGVTTNAFPGAGFGPVVTNANLTSTGILPNPIPTGIATNTTWVTSPTLPSPVPAGIITNITTTTTTSSGYPAAGSYIGGVTTNYQGNGNSKKITDYTYNLITGTTYSFPTYTYIYPSFTYTYFPNPVYTTNHYDYIVKANTTNYADSVSGKSVYIAGANAVLILLQGLSGSEDFTIALGGSLLIYAGGTSVTISGNQVMNPNGFAGSFIVYCAPSVTSFTLNGNGTFTGIVVAPNAALALNGSGSTDQDFCGAIMVNSAKLNGHFHFHYDEALSKAYNNGRYLITSWNEVTPTH